MRIMSLSGESIMKHRIGPIYIAVFMFMLLFSFQNCSPAPFIELSSLASSSAVVINKNAEFTNNTDAMLQINYDGAIQMYITNNPDCSSGGEWQPISSELPWHLSEKNKATSVYVKFKDNIANLESETPCVSDSIIHDDIPPLLSLSQPILSKTNTASINIKLNMSDLGSGIDKLVCPSGVSPCAVDMIISNSTDGLKSLDFYALDKAGNESATPNASWLVDRTPPQTMFVSTPATKTNLTSANFVISANDNYSAAEAIKLKCLFDTGTYQDCNSTFAFSNLNDGAHSVKIYAYDEVGNASNPISYSWIIGRSTPSIRFTVTPKPNTNITGQFTFAGSDQFGTPLTQFQCSLNNSVFTACATPYLLTILNEGANKFKVKGTDSLGNESGALEYNWAYDTIIPIITWVSYPTKFSKNRNESIKISVSGDAQPLESIEFFLDGKSLVNSLADATNLTGLSEGFHTVRVSITDKAGNKNAADSKTFWSDFTRPTLSFPPIGTPSKNTNLNLAVTAADNNTAPDNTVNLFYILDETAVIKPYAAFGSSLVISGLTHGTHLIKIYAVDAAGNQSITYLSNPFLVDLTAPVITFIQQPSSEISSARQVTVQYLVQDMDTGLNSVSCKFSDSKKVISSGACADKATFSLPIYGSETYIFEISAIDNVGNPASVKAITWKTGVFFDLKTQAFSVTEQKNNKVDILLVIDNSKSMAEEQQKISVAFADFLTNLGSINYRIAITTTDVYNDKAGTKGKILPFATSNLTYITPATLDGLALFQAAVKTGTTGSGHEKGLTAIQLFINRALALPETALDGSITTTNEYKFLRSDAIFSTIVVTDSDEAKYPESYQTAQSFLTDFSAKLPTKTYIHHSSIVLPGDDVCVATGEHYGVTYFDLSKATGGISVSLCDITYANQLKNFATLIINKINEQTLACAPVDINKDGKVDIDISYTSATGATGKIIDYTIADKTVKFIAPLTIVGNYVITYSCLTP